LTEGIFKGRVSDKLKEFTPLKDVVNHKTGEIERKRKPTVTKEK
jgi:hypothetical protein